jgi:hypothetical protein
MVKLRRSPPMLPLAHVSEVTAMIRTGESAGFTLR